MAERIVPGGMAAIVDEDTGRPLGYRDTAGRNWFVPGWATDANGNAVGMVGPDGRLTGGALPIIAGGSGWVPADGGNFVTAVSRTVPAGRIAGCLLRVRVQATKSGTSGGWGVAVQLGGVTLCQWYPTATQRTLTGEHLVWINSDLGGTDVEAAPNFVVTTQNPASLSTVANYGTSSVYGPTSGGVGGLGAGNLALTCIVAPNNTDDVRVDYFVVESVPVACDVPARAVACWGDSLTVGVGASASGIRGTGWSQQLRYTDKRQVYMGGIGGQTAQQIAARALADQVRRHWTTIIWAGRNNVGQANMATAVPEQVARMVGNLSHDRFLVLSVTPGIGEAVGGANRTAITACNAALAAAYGVKYLDLVSLLADATGLVASNATTSNPGEVHFNDTGYTTIYNAVVAKLASLGY